MSNSSRLQRCFKNLQNRSRTALIPFITAGDPDRETSLSLLLDLPKWGADIVELGMPFSDPSADGPAIQRSSQRALTAGIRTADILDMVRQFRQQHPDTPLILMGYYCPIHAYGVERFADDAAKAGVDGLIAVDVPPEEDMELHTALKRVGIDMIRFAAPTTDADRLQTILRRASGFLYYVSIAGITGTKRPDMAVTEQRMKEIRAAAGKLPVVIGFGVSTPEQIRQLTPMADGIVVGSAIVRLIEEAITYKKGAHKQGKDTSLTPIRDLVRSLSSAIA